MLAGVARFELTNEGVKVPCLTAWRYPYKLTLIIVSQIGKDVNIFGKSFIFERMKLCLLGNTVKNIYRRIYMNRRVKKYLMLFLIGAVGYAAIEVIWRGRTHWSMMIAGGICFILFSLVSRALGNRSIFLKAAACAIAITAVEFVFGVIFNIVLKMNVWDYSAMPINLLGQICPEFTLLWGGIALAFLPFADAINKSYA